MDTVLTRTQSELVGLERRLVLRVRDAITKAGGPPDDVERLGALVHEMDELFLLVVVGEYNAGKSTFINALLGDEVFETGDLPTTRVISILRYGDGTAYSGEWTRPGDRRIRPTADEVEARPVSVERW